MKGIRSWVILVAVIIGSIPAHADVQWSRLKGKVKGVNGKTSQLTIQNKEGDLLTVKIDADVILMKGKDEVHLKDVAMDEPVTLLYMPKAPTPKESEDVPEGGFYKPLK